MATLAVTACSHHSHAPSRSKSAPTGAAARYLQLAATANSEIDAARTRLRTTDTDLTATEGDLRAIADAKRAFDGALRSTTFPAAIQPAIDRLLDADAELERRLDAGAAAAGPGELAAASPAILDAGQAAVSSADAVRRLLGLPTLD